MHDEMVRLFFLGLFFGFAIGTQLMAWRWRSNAAEIQRIESGGRLFKVLTDAQYSRVEAMLQWPSL